VAARVDVYEPEGWDLAEHLKRVTAFNNRRDREAKGDRAESPATRTAGPADRAQIASIKTGHDITTTNLSECIPPGATVNR